MAEPTGDQDTDNGRGGSESRAQNDEDTQEPQPVLPIAQPDQQAGNPAQPPARRRRKKSSCNIGTIIELFVGCALIGVGWLQYMVYTRQANIMEIGERPWVSLQSAELLSSLTIKDDNASVWLKYKLKNVGHSPAFDVSFYAAIVPIWINKAVGIIRPDLDENDPSMAKIDDMGKATKLLCEATFALERTKEEKRHLTEKLTGEHVGYNFFSVGTTIFPDETIEAKTKAVKEHFITQRAADPKAIAESYFLMITTCVRYVEPQSGKIHFTARPYQLFAILPDDKEIYALKFGPTEISIKNLSLRAGESQYAD